MGRLIGTTTSYSFLTSRNFTNAYTLRRSVQPNGIHRPGERLDGVQLRHAEPADISCSTVGIRQWFVRVYI